MVVFAATEVITPIQSCALAKGMVRSLKPQLIQYKQIFVFQE